MKYAFADCELDTASFELRRQGRVCAIEPKVFELLRYFVENPNRLIGKDELFEKIWHGRIVSDSALSSQIKAARRAIGDAGGSQQLLKTVHGRGFRFVGEVQLRNEDESRKPQPIANEKQTSVSEPPISQDIRYCKTPDGVQIAYAIAGKGYPILKCANWMSHLQYEWESPIWRHWMAGLSAHNQLIRYDQRGNGLSDWEVADMTFPAMIADLECVADAVGLKRFALLGISRGAAISVAYAVKHPERVSHLILYGGRAKGWRSQGDPAEIARRSAMLTLIRTGWGQDNPAFRKLFASLFIPDATEEQAEWFTELQRRTISPENAAKFQEVASEVDVAELLPQISVPTLVLHATKDAVVPFEAGRAFATHIPGARFVPLESKNHILLEEEPAFAQLLNEVTRFLAR